MKASIIFLTVLAGNVISQLGPDIDDGRKFSHIVRMINMKLTVQGKTTFTYSEIVKKIQNYGCHCFPGMSRIAGGVGAPVDQLDSACRKLARCHKCVDIEYNRECDVDFGKYKWSFVGVSADEVECQAGQTDCKMSQCACDKEFADEIATFWDDANYNTYYWLNKHNVKQNPTFDFASTCVSGANNVQADMCCGDQYPSKQPYDSTQRMCCDQSGRTYNDAMEDCCPDGSIKTLGSC